MFHAWLLGDDRQMGGTSAATVLRNLPTALKQAVGKHFESAPALSKRMTRALTQGAREVPPVIKRRRRPARLDTLRRVCEDASVPQPVRDAIAFMYRTAARGVDVVVTSQTLGDISRPLLFSDLELQGEVLYVRFSREKAAKRRGGHFTATPLLPAPAVCAVAAVARARARATRGGVAPPPEAPVFPGVTSRHVTAALRKHGVALSAHSTRKGALTDARAAGGDTIDIRLRGRIDADSTVFTYLSIPPEAVAAAQAAEGAPAAPPPALLAPPPPPASEDGYSSADTDGASDDTPPPSTGQMWEIANITDIRFLLALRPGGGLRAYAYASDGARLDVVDEDGGPAVPCVDVEPAAMDAFMANLNFLAGPLAGDAAVDAASLRNTAAAVPALPARDAAAAAAHLAHDAGSGDSDSSEDSAKTWQTGAEEDVGEQLAPLGAPAAAAFHAGGAAPPPAAGAPPAPGPLLRSRAGRIIKPKRVFSP